MRLRFTHEMRLGQIYISNSTMFGGPSYRFGDIANFLQNPLLTSSWPLIDLWPQICEHPVCTHHRWFICSSAGFTDPCRKEKKRLADLDKMTSSDPYVTFDPDLWTPLMRLGSVVLLTEFGRSRPKGMANMKGWQKKWEEIGQKQKTLESALLQERERSYADVKS